MGAQDHTVYRRLPSHRDGYVDFFSENDALREPVILQDGTSVQFPKGWTDEDADKWRKGMELQRPDDYRATSFDMLGLLVEVGILPPHPK
jgi:hypothetical protein